MKHAEKRLCGALAAAIMLSGCTHPLEYKENTPPAVTTSESETEKDPQSETEIIPEVKDSADRYRPSDFVVAQTDYSETYQPEFNTDAYAYTDGLAGYNGSGYIRLGSGEHTVLKVTVPSSQHYKIGLRICSTGCKVSLLTGGTEDASEPDGNAAGAVYVRESVMFSYVYLDAVYLQKGENNLTINTLSGIAYVDEISIENSETVPALAYAVSTGCINKNADEMTKTVKKYLSDVYGNKVITGQFCSAGTNTEINAVYMSTGRYSAMRCGDLGIFSEHYEGSDKNDENEIAAAADWWKSGGLVSYTWYWYAPSDEKSHYFAEMTDFKLSDAVCDVSAALLDAEGLQTYEQTGKVTRGCYDLLRDIDIVASKLKLLQAQGVPVIFRPLPQAGNGWYWWGEDAESYLWLYELIYRRLTEYHGLNNLIWVWNGESYEFYPGDEYADIVSMDIYTDSDISGNSRMLDAIHYTIRTKPCALTECGRVPNPDLLKRDNSYWLWFGLWRGDYIINADGSVSYEHTSAEDLDYAYNNELFITKDELPDFSRYF